MPTLADISVTGWESDVPVDDDFNAITKYFISVTNPLISCARTIIARPCTCSPDEMCTCSGLLVRTGVIVTTTAVNCEGFVCLP